jgi:hypothetical protein
MNKKPFASTIISEIFSKIKFNLSDTQADALPESLNSNDNQDLNRLISILKKINVLLIIDDI